MNDDERRASLLAEAKAIREAFGRVEDPEERRRLEERYEQIDRRLEDLKQGSPEYSQDLAFQLEASLRREIIERNKKASGPLRDEVVYKAEVEKGRKRLMEKVAAGAGAARSSRIKTELNYLLANYTSANDGKIETLIDQWRRSGDPGYDPAIKVRYRDVRRKAETFKHPF